MTPPEFFRPLKQRGVHQSRIVRFLRHVALLHFLRECKAQEQEFPKAYDLQIEKAERNIKAYEKGWLK